MKISQVTLILTLEFPMVIYAAAGATNALMSSQVKSSLLHTRLQLKAELIHIETIEKCYA